MKTNPLSDKLLYVPNSARNVNVNIVPFIGIDNYTSFSQQLLFFFFFNINIMAVKSSGFYRYF